MFYDDVAIWFSSLDFSASDKEAPKCLLQSIPGQIPQIFQLSLGSMGNLKTALILSQDCKSPGGCYTQVPKLLETWFGLIRSCRTLMQIDFLSFPLDILWRGHWKHGGEQSLEYLFLFSFLQVAYVTGTVFMWIAFFLASS